MEQPRTLVTGANGFAGSHLLDLLPATTPIVAWHHPETAALPDSGPHIEWQGVDITDRESVRRAIHDVRPGRVYHLAGAPSVETSWRNAVPHLQVNALGTHHLLECVREAAPSCRLLVVSSAQVYQVSDRAIDEDIPLVPTSPYGLTKLAQDQLALRAYADDGLDTIVARSFNHIGPRQTPNFAASSFARQIARIESGLVPPIIRVGNLEARRDITDVRDVAAAYIALMEKGRPGRAYNVCSGRAWRTSDVLEELRRRSAIEVAVETDPDRLRPSDVPVIQGDPSRIRAETGWTPSISVEQALADMLDWWRAQPAADS